MAVIKICGLSRPEDIDAVNEAGPDYCGFIIDFPKSHRNVTTWQVSALRKKLSDGIVPVGVIVDQPIEKAAMLLNEGIVDVIQLHGHEDEVYIEQLRKLLEKSDAANGQCAYNTDRKKQIWQAFKIRSYEDLEKVAISSADAIILDNGYGTGETFDWSILSDASELLSEKKIFLAGGLTPDNIEAAVSQLGVWGIDISSGVETDQKKDRIKILAAVAAARRAGGRKQ